MTCAGGKSSETTLTSVSLVTNMSIAASIATMPRRLSGAGVKGIDPARGW
jgi:hypothetical protein